MAGKRGNGEGTIYRRASDGKWVCAVSLESGKRRTVYGATRAEAAAKLTAVLHDHSTGSALAGPDVTVATFLDRWLADSVSGQKRPKTERFYRQLVRDHIIPELGRLKLRKLAPADVQAMLKSRQASGLSGRTVSHIRTVLRTALNVAMRWELVNRNVAALTEPPRVINREQTVITESDARVVLAAVSGDRLESLYSLALALGLRQGEILALRWQDVDLEASVLHVTASLQRINGTLQRVEPKTRQSRRTLPLSGFAAEIIRQQRVRQAKERLWAGSGWADSGHIFTTQSGAPLDGVTVTKRFQKLLRDASVAHMRFHDLRHGAASLLAAQGVPARVAMELLGHADIRTTLNIYTHSSGSMTRDAVERVGAALSA